MGGVESPWIVDKPVKPLMWAEPREAWRLFTSLYSLQSPTLRLDTPAPEPETLKTQKRKSWGSLAQPIMMPGCYPRRVFWGEGEGLASC